MTVARTARRRRKQAKMGNKHIALHGTPPRRVYHKHSTSYYATKLRKLIEKEKNIALNKARSKKK